MNFPFVVLCVSVLILYNNVYIVLFRKSSCIKTTHKTCCKTAICEKTLKKVIKKVHIIFAVSEKACNFAPAFERDGKQIDRVLRLTR